MVVPTDGRGKRRSQPNSESPAKRGPVPAVQTERLFYGATYLFDQIGVVTGVTADLKTCFPATYKQLLSIAYYLILEDQNPLFRFRKWSKLHRHPYGHDIPSQRSSEIFQSVTEEAKMHFFRLQGKRRAEKEYWAYDSTSISSYSETMKQIRYGKNKDGENLPQINLALLFGEDSGLPFYYRKLAGNIPDVKTIRELIRELDVLGYEKIKLVMDRGYYSADNINALYKEHLKFLCGTSTAVSFAKAFIREIGAQKDHYEYYNSDLELYIFSRTIAWDYEQERPYIGDTVHEERRMYLHLYFNPDKLSDDGKIFNKKLIDDLDQLRALALEKTTRRDELLSSIKEFEKWLAEIAALKKHIINYSKTRAAYEAYRKAGYSKKFFEAHREEITLHKASKKAFDELGVRKIPKVKELSAEYAEILSGKKATYAEYRKVRDEAQELIIAERNIASLYETDAKEQEHQTKEKTH